jgi:glycerol kinase
VAELPQLYPRPGWVEHDPDAILRVTRQAIGDCLAAPALRGARVVGIGLANQGETVVVWDRASGRPVCNAITWQDKRTTNFCNDLKRQGWASYVHERTGVFLDPYFSATKLRWILDHTPDGQRRAETGELLAGTTDTWLLWNLSGRQLHITDPSTASRTMLFNLRSLGWDADMLALFCIPHAMLAGIVPSAGIAGELFLTGSATATPIAGLAVDQQAALFGQGCLRPGMMKITYGTGAFALMTTGAEPVFSDRGLLTTVAWRLLGATAYALDGGVLMAGGALQWLRDGLGILDRVDDSEVIGASVKDSGGVYLVPALAGLAAPYWAPEARGVILGLTSHTTRAHLVRAALEGIALSVCDVVEAMSSEIGRPPAVIRVDGGPTRNQTLMQIQADVLGRTIETAAVAEATARGAAMLAGVGCGWWSPEDATSRTEAGRTFTPRGPEQERQARRERWRRAIDIAKTWMTTQGGD